MLVVYRPSLLSQSLPTKSPIISTKDSRKWSPSIAFARAQSRPADRRSTSALETRISLVLALASQSSSLSRRIFMAVLGELAAEAGKYAFPRRSDAGNLQEGLMSVPDLETIRFKVLKRTNDYEIREVEPYLVAETTMPGKTGFDFVGSSRSFNVLAEYLFGKNISREKMEMTTPVFTKKVKSAGEKMDMTTPVITKKSDDQDTWVMSFVMPSKYGQDLPVPKDSSVRIKEVPRKLVAVAVFSGLVTDLDVERRDSKLRDALRKDQQFQVKEGALVEVAQYNPPFTLPFMRRNEIALEVERKTSI